jgi:ribosomal protein L21
MYAVIKTGGKQHRVSEGDVVIIEKINGGKGDAVVFDQILMVEKEGDIRIGRPIGRNPLPDESRQAHRVQDEEAQGVSQEKRAPPAADQYEDQGNIDLSGGHYGT